MRNDEMPPGFGPNDSTAGDRAENEYARATFHVEENRPHADGTEAEPWISILLDEPGLKVLRPGDASLGLECRRGVTLAEATRLAEEMRRLLAGISYLKFIT